MFMRRLVDAVGSVSFSGEAGVELAIGLFSSRRSDLIDISCVQHAPAAPGEEGGGRWLLFFPGECMGNSVEGGRARAAIEWQDRPGGKESLARSPYFIRGGGGRWAGGKGRKMPYWACGRSETLLSLAAQTAVAILIPRTAYERIHVRIRDAMQWPAS